MIKRTLYFGNPAYLKTQMEQLVISYPAEVVHGEVLPEKKITIPVEDIAVVILDHQQITISQALIARLLEHNVALITCNQSHHPTGLMLNLAGNSLQSARFRFQTEATLPLKKQLWQQTVAAKIYNQAQMLESVGVSAKQMYQWARDVKSGDAENHEALAAVYYWKNLFPIFPQFKRHREGDPPNNLLNYGYAILRAIVARNLVGSGLLPTLGIFHRNQYNAYCLADDIMEPYRPYVDKLVWNIVRQNGKFLELTPAMKKELLSIPVMDVIIQNEKSPLMLAVQTSTASLAKCFEGNLKKISYPQFQ